MSKTTNKFAPEVRERAVRMVLDHEKDHASRWAAATAIAVKIGCSAYTLLEWVKKAEVTELALFNSHGHPDGGQRVQRHEHALVFGTDVHRKAAEVAAKHAKRFSPNFTGARAIDIKKVATDEVNLTRVAAYLFKPPY